MENDYFMSESVVSSRRILYTPSDFARTSLLYLQEIGSLRALKKHTSKREGLRSYLFFVVLSGSGSFIYENRYHELNMGDCVFIDCHHPYSHTTSDNLWSLQWCHFYGATLSLIYEKYMQRGGKPTFRPNNTEPFLSLLDRIYSIADSSDYIRDMRINEELNRLCTFLMAESWHPESIAAAGIKKSSVVPVKAFLDQHYAEKITLDQLAHVFFINKYYLTRVFKEQFGLSITAYLQAIRVTHAKHMLRFTDKTVEEIGVECGLGQLHYFSRVFKAIEGVPPSIYRRQWHHSGNSQRNQ